MSQGEFHKHGIKVKADEGETCPVELAIRKTWWPSQEPTY